MSKAKDAISFAQALQSKQHFSDAFWAPLDEYIDICNNWIAEQRIDENNLLRRYEGDLIEKEKHTWQLLRLLEEERTKPLHGTTQVTRPSIAGFTDKHLLEVLREKDAQLRENMVT